jgi:hypothetical protein
VPTFETKNQVIWETKPKPTNIKFSVSAVGTVTLTELCLESQSELGVFISFLLFCSFDSINHQLVCEGCHSLKPVPKATF